MWQCVFVLLIFQTVSAQLNGEFWWLNDKLKELKGVEPSPVKIEDDTGYENDDTDRIMFNKIEITTQSNIDMEKNKTNQNVTNDIKFKDKSIIVWPDDSGKANNNSNFFEMNTKKDDNDDFVFKFPDNDIFSWKELLVPKVNKTTPIKGNKAESDDIEKVQNYNNGKVHFKTQYEEFKLVENICTYIKKVECNQRNGKVYIQPNSYLHKITFGGANRVCCILPLPIPTKNNLDTTTQVVTISKKSKRSLPKEEISIGLRQRDALMLRKINIQRNTDSKPIKPTVTQKIVSGNDEYDDPYWNVKNSNPKQFQTNSNPYTLSPDDIYDEVYDDDQIYTDDLPKPGLTGLYSDNGPSPASWTFMDRNTKSPYSEDSESIEDEGSFGYSTINPRLVRSPATPRPLRRRKTVKKTTLTSDEFSYSAESHTIRYQSKPDFQVLQGYKLLNLYRNRSKIYYKTGNKATTASVFDKGSQEVFTRPASIDYSEGDYDLNELGRQVYGDCGKTSASFILQRGNSRLSPEAAIGSHPWLGLVVLTRKPQSILCYATTIHPKAAITVGDCVYGRSKGEITLIVGVRDLSESRTSAQQRMLSTILHPRFQPGKLTNNIAILHWKRPLSLGDTVQPVCLSEPNVGDECRFVGWGGYDQDIKPRARWQRAEVLTPQECGDRVTQISHDLPSDAFCASVESRNSVTGVGGPLICEINGRQSAVGMALWRGKAIVMQSVQKWPLQATSHLNL